MTDEEHREAGTASSAAPAGQQGRPPRGEPLVCADLVVAYDEFCLGPVDVRLPLSQIVSLLGPNGSGKSTLIRTMLGFQPPVRGDVRWGGASLVGHPPEVFASIGSLSDSAEDCLPELAPVEYWEYCALAYRRHVAADVDALLGRAHDLARKLGLGVTRSRRISALSLGMQRKAQLVAALMHAPTVILLDEPLIGLDFLANLALQEVLLEERARGALVVAASHDLGLAEGIADSLVLLYSGEVLAHQPVGEMAAGGSLAEAVQSRIRVARAGEGPWP